MPDIDLGLGDGETGCGGQDSSKEQGVVCGIATGFRQSRHNGAIHGKDWSVGAPEGAKDSGGGGIVGCGRGVDLGGESNGVDEGFNTENVTDELCLIAGIGGEFSRVVDLGKSAK